VTRAAALELSAVGDDLEERFSELVVSHRDRARRLAWRLIGGDESAAEDVAQDAFVKAYRALGAFREDASLETWFYRILVNQAQNHRRWRGVRERWSAVWDERHAVDSSDVGDPALQRRIAEALSKLTRRQRESFVLVHLEGFTVRETGELLGTPEGTIKSHLQRALKALRSELADVRRTNGRSQP
jgi:RNA polymerase sigma-70 factor (ECF subfamily)